MSLRPRHSVAVQNGIGASQDSKPRVSVVVPVWDTYVSGFLEEALASLVAQSCPADLIVIDNASVIPVSVNRDGIRVIRAPTRLTYGGARNLGLRSVRTPLVVMWDADDVMVPGTLGFLCERATADPRIVAYAAAIVDLPSGRRHRWPRRWVSLLTRRPGLLAVINSIWSVYPTTGATVMRTEVVREAGGYRAMDGAEDWSLGVAMLWRGRVGWSERPGRFYRRHDASTWRSHSTARHLLRHSREVRELLRQDPAVPAWFRRALPVIQLAQYAAILGVRPIIRVTRSVGRRTPRPSRTPNASKVDPLIASADLPGEGVDTVEGVAQLDALLSHSGTASA